MLRRAPTVLAITAEDVADYEDRRAEALEALHSLQNPHAHPGPHRLRSSKPPAPNWASYHHDAPRGAPAGLASDSEEYPATAAHGIESDEEEEEEERGAEAEGDGGVEQERETEREESTMDVDMESSLALPPSSSPAAARAMGRGAGGVGGFVRGGGVRGGLGGVGGQSRSGRGGLPPGRPERRTQAQERTAMPVGGLPAAQAQLQARAQAQGGRAAVAAGDVVTPEARPTRSREERIGVAQAPERRRR